MSDNRCKLLGWQGIRYLPSHWSDDRKPAAPIEHSNTFSLLCVWHRLDDTHITDVSNPWLMDSRQRPFIPQLVGSTPAGVAGKSTDRIIARPTKRMHTTMPALVSA
eukprot:scaffold415592_cov19-Prasinocladus_malaysianus.AAC.1